jgi:hypothetical protein
MRIIRHSKHSVSGTQMMPPPCKHHFAGFVNEFIQYLLANKTVQDRKYVLQTTQWLPNSKLLKDLYYMF